ARTERDRQTEPIAAPRALEHFVRGHEIRRLRSALVLQLTSRRARLRRPRRFRTARPARLSFVLIAALTVFPIAHLLPRLFLCSQVAEAIAQRLRQSCLDVGR